MKRIPFLFLQILAGILESRRVPGTRIKIKGKKECTT
jgi:hypothetical protein